MKYEIAPISKLIPLEQVFPHHLENIEKMIYEDGYVLKPIIADKKTGTVLDGSHRYAFFLKNGYEEAPIIWVDYQDENIRVGTNLIHRFFIENTPNITKQICLQRALSCNLFPPRTTRHFFTFRKNDISLPLDTLKKGKEHDISHLLYDADISHEISHNKKYIDEINQEIEMVVKYLAEVSETKEYLKKQIAYMEGMRPIAFFPGKFHPPHFGHIQTILKTLPHYKQVIVGVSEHLPINAITSPLEILDALKEFFANFHNVRVVLIKGILVEKQDLNDLPYFDVLLSGNDEVLEWGKNHELSTQYIARSSSEACSGSNIREIILNESK
jgi:nicotinamide mononucleotide adenylyltransferase